MMKVALLGFGTVGKGFYELAKNCPELEIAGVLSRRPRPELSCLVTPDFDELLSADIDIVVEVMGGTDPALDYITKALSHGKHVVTANKQVMCEGYDAFTALAKKNNVGLLCTAAAGGGIPWLRSLARARDMDRILKVEGILNGTTNFILDAMYKDGADYGGTLKKAQELGYAEADPTADVEGYDARRKLVLSANIAFGVSLREQDIPCEGISLITAENVAEWKAQGLVPKLIASAEMADGKINAFVKPMLFKEGSIEASCASNNNLVSLYGEKIGKQSFYGQGAGAYPTGSNVLADCLEIERGHRGFY